MAVIASRELADAKAEYLASVEKVALAQARFSREQRLWRKKITAEQEYLDARQALAEGRIVLRAAEHIFVALPFLNTEDTGDTEMTERQGPQKTGEVASTERGNGCADLAARLTES